MGRDYTQTLPVERLGPSDVDIWGNGGAPGTEMCSEPNVEWIAQTEYLPQIARSSFRNHRELWDAAQGHC